MSIIKVPDGYRVDCRGADGKRHRRTFAVRADARDFEFKMKYGAAPKENRSGTPLHEAIQKFCKIELAPGINTDREKQYLSDLYDFLIDEVDLEFIHQVETIHLDHYQSILKNQDLRVELWNKIESNRKKECLARGEGYIPKPMHNKYVQALSGNSIRRRFVVIKAFFKKAKAWKWIETNPCLDMVIKSSVCKTRQPWSDQQINTAIDKARSWAKRPFWLIAVTGMRPVGACRMELTDLDFANREFWVTSFKGKGGIARRHKMVMTNDLYEFFTVVSAEVRQRPMIGPFKNKLFLSANNTELLPNYLTDEMRRVADLMGLKSHSLYGFRHSMATAAANPSRNGQYVGNLEVARQILGHTSISQTADYNHTDDQLLREQFEKLSELRQIRMPKL